MQLNMAIVNGVCMFSYFSSLWAYGGIVLISSLVVESGHVIPSGN